MTRTSSPSAPALTLGAVEWGLIIFQAIAWGSTFFFIAYAKPHVSMLTLSAVRLFPAALFLLAVVSVLGLRLPATRGTWGRLIAFAALNNAVPMLCIIWAQREIAGGTAAIFMALGPLWALVLAPWFIAEERFTWPRLIGIGIGVLGVAIITGASSGSGTWRAQATLLFAAFLFACANIYARKFLGGLHPFVVALCQVLGSIFLIVPLVLWLEPPWQLQNPTGKVWLAMILMGLIGSGLAPLCHFTVLRRAGPVNSMLSSILVPISPIILGAIFLGEHLTAREFLGGLIIAAGLIVIDGRPVAWLRARVAGR